MTRIESQKNRIAAVFFACLMRAAISRLRQTASGPGCVKTLRQNRRLRVYAKSENYRLLS